MNSFAPRDCPKCGGEWSVSVKSAALSEVRAAGVCPRCRIVEAKKAHQNKNVAAQLKVKAGPWMSEAVCATATDPELWFVKESTADAKAVCRTCPVILECRLFALDNGYRDGIWGGMDGPGRRLWAKRTVRS